MKLHSRCLMFNLLLLVFASSALGVAPSSSSPPIASLHEKRDSTCGFTGNSDLYGLGIRLGVYFQWISAFVIWGWYEEGIEELTGAFLSFVFALLIAMIVVTLQTQPAYVAEILMLTYILFGGTMTVTVVGTMSRGSSKGAKPMGFRSIEFWIIMILYCAGGVYCSWFWLYGYHHDFLSTPCGTFGFLFTRVSLYHPPVTKFFAALSVYIGILYGCILLVGLAISILFLFKVPTVVKWVNRLDSDEFAPTTRHDQEFAFRHLKKDWWSFVVLAFLLTTLVYSMVGIELTIYWNSISGVYTINTTGQLIPFIIGLLGLSKLIYMPLSRWCKRYWASTASEGDGNSDPARESLRDEAREVNRRLEYLDLTRPVEGSVIHNWRRDGLRRRNEQA